MNDKNHRLIKKLALYMRKYYNKSVLNACFVDCVLNNIDTKKSQ